MLENFFGVSGRILSCRKCIGFMLYELHLLNLVTLQMIELLLIEAEDMYDMMMPMIIMMDV